MWCQWISAAKTEIRWQESLLKTTSIFNNVQPFPGWNDLKWLNWRKSPFSILSLIKQTTCSGVVIFPGLWWQESDPEPAEPPVVNVVDVGSTVSFGESNAARDEDGMAYVSFWVWCQRLKHWEKLMADEFDHRIMWSNWAVFGDLNCETVWSCEVGKCCGKSPGADMTRLAVFCEALDDSCSFSNLNFSERYPTRAPFFDVSGNAVWYWGMHFVWFVLYAVLHLTTQYVGTVLSKHISTWYM